MSNLRSAALAADFQPLPLEIITKALNTFGVLSLTIMVGILTFAVEMPALERTVLGLLSAAVIVGAGQVLSRRSDQSWWFGTSLMASGYALAYVVAHASHYVSGASAFEQPYASWLLQLGLVGLVTAHANRNSLLRWLALPFSIAISAQILFSALLDSSTIAVGTLTVTVSELASVAGTLWWSLLSLSYKQLQTRCSKDSAAAQDSSAWWLFGVASELCFVLALLNAMALPKYLSTLQQAPLWWSVEMPVMLAVCWRSNNFIKHALIMAIWAASALLMLFGQLDLPIAWCMAVPLSGLVMGLAYRLLTSSRARWQNLTGYAAYLYGSAAVALAVPLLKLGPTESMIYWLFEAGMLLALALALRDRLLHMIACLASVAALLLYGAHRQDWALWLMLSVVAACYAMCLVYARIAKNGGLLQSDFAPLPTKYVLFGKEARWLEFAAAIAGYASWITGSYFLLADPSHATTWWTIVFSNTFAWWAAGLLMVFYGLRTDKLEHRFLGVGSWFLGTAKMGVFDLAGSGTVGRAVATAVAGAICCFGLARLYQAAFEAYRRGLADPPSDSNDQDETPPASGGPDNLD
jgi:hypothetical protein